MPHIAVQGSEWKRDKQASKVMRVGEVGRRSSQ